MFGKTYPEVLVVGAGPVGLCAALALAKREVRVAIVDKEWRSGAHSYALALHARTLDLLQELGLRDRVMSRALPIRTIGLYDGERRRSELNVAAAGSDDVVAVMRQDVLEQVLEQALVEMDVPVLWNHSVSRLATRPSGAMATVDKLVKESVGYAVARTEWMVAKSADVEVPFVIAADGHQSLARRALGIDFPEVAPPQHYAVFEFDSDFAFGDELRLMCGDRATDVVWPLPDNHCRWSFELLDEEAPGTTRAKNRIPMDIGGTRFPWLDEERLHQLLAERAAWFTGRIEQIYWRILVRFEKRLATSFGRDRIWLAGDAGHLTGPAGMQSMNVGLREARQLADAVTNSLRNGGDRTQLDAYSSQREAEWKFLLGLSGGLVGGTQTDPWIAQCSSRLLSCLPASGNDLTKLGQQIGLVVR